MVKNDLNIHTVYNAGDSFATGVGLHDPKVSSYPVKIAEAFDSKLISLARPGCCNFSISLMIKYFVDNFDEDAFYIISTTNEDRLHWLKPGIVYSNEQEVTIQDLNYEDYKENLLTDLPFNSNNILQSETCSNILLFKEGGIPTNKTLKNEPESRLNTLCSYVKEVHDSKIKRYEDCGIFATQLHRLNQLTSNWVLFTMWHELEEMFPNNFLQVDYGIVSKEYPDDLGSGHFNRTGHRVIARKFEEWYTKNYDVSDKLFK